MPHPIQFMKANREFIPLVTIVGGMVTYAGLRWYNRTQNQQDILQQPAYTERVKDDTVFHPNFNKDALNK